MTEVRPGAGRHARRARGPLRGAWAVALAAATVAALSGCWPARFSGYRPSGPGRLESGYCVRGAADTLRIAAPAGVEIHLRVGVATLRGPAGAAGRVLEPDVRIAVPEGASARLTGNVVRVESAQWRGPRELEVREILAPGPRAFAATDTLPGSSQDSRGGYALALAPAGPGDAAAAGLPAPARFTLRLPVIEVNGAPFDAGPVDFEAFEAWGAYSCAQ